MKKAYSIVRGLFAIIGILAVVTVLFFSTTKKYEVNVNKTNLALFSARVDSLRASGQYAVDTNDFSIRIIQDSLRAKEIRDYFQLDTLYSANATTWEKALAIGRFVATNIPHDNQVEWPKNVNSIGLWEYTKTIAPAFNCRLHSILTFELFLAADIQARYITCLPQDKTDNDCHVVNEVWLPELGKWAMIDTDMGGHYVTDRNGNLLSLKEMREHYISGERMIMYEDLQRPIRRPDWYYAYMAKNTYWFSCWGELSYYQEDWNKTNDEVVRDHYFHLIPSGFEPFNIGGGETITTNAKQFWAAPNEL